MTQPPNPRALALSALQAVARREAYADAVLDGLFSRHSELSPRDRALVSHLVYGVLRWRNRLDAHIAFSSSRPLRRIHPRVLFILRLGAYQLLFLDRIPERAAVDESVELTRASGLAPAAGFVNAVLRKLASAGREIGLPEGLEDRLSLLFGCPRWLVEAWLGEHGGDGAEALCRAASTIPTLMLRVDVPRVQRDRAVEDIREDGLDAGPGAHGPEAVWIDTPGDPRGLAVVRAGLAVVQDQASQLVTHVLAPEPGWSVLDACGGPGLKATHIARLMEDRGRVTALDLHPARVQRIQELSKRLETSAVHAECADAREYRPSERFDGILVDAPCSGLGVLGRTPEAKWRRRPEDLAALPPLQLSILESVAGLAKPGGVLVYATCTNLRAENEEVVESFLRRHPDFVLEAPPEGSVDWDGLLSAEGHFRTYPWHVGEGGSRALDGFFAARLRRRGSGQTC